MSSGAVTKSPSRPITADAADVTDAVECDVDVDGDDVDSAVDVDVCCLDEPLVV